jgi:hypothetical protein
MILFAVTLVCVGGSCGASVAGSWRVSPAGRLQCMSGGVREGLGFHLCGFAGSLQKTGHEMSMTAVVAAATSSDLDLLMPYGN